MNFNYSEDQLTIRDAAERIFRDLCADDALRDLYRKEPPFHRELWQALASAGLLAATLPAEFGGSEMGMTELGQVLELHGKSVAPIPLVETVVECAMPIAQFGGDALKKRVLPGVAGGEILLSFVRPYQGLRDREPLSVSKQGDSWKLNGASALVNYAPLANGFLVTATSLEGEAWVGYCDANAAGIEVVAQRSTSAELAGHISFSNVEVSAENTLAFGEQANELLEWQVQRIYTATAAQQVGVLAEGLRRAAEYTNERKQFGRSISSFQSVAQQAADAWMAIEALRGVYWRALDDLENVGQAEISARVAKFWIAEAGHVAAHIFLHLHGGMGQDLDYPLHRFFLWAKKNEIYRGGASTQAAALGALIAAHPERVAV
ncbi:predicted acyl-CoA dehydrogenase [gamma proteobacterium HdN1]|nr:predicted acyl-CoA dehydrogenase [gamma proteobacterium HdN1]